MAAQVVVAEGIPSHGQPVTERPARSMPGLPMLVLGIALIAAGIAMAVLAAHQHGSIQKTLVVAAVVAFVLSSVELRGLTAVVPGQARVVQLFGEEAMRAAHVADRSDQNAEHARRERLAHCQFGVAL